jgi:hypothetical protein
MKMPVMDVVVMEAGEMRERVTGECMAGDGMRRKHMAAETVAGKGVAAKASVAASAAAVATAAAVTAAAAAMCNGAGRPYRCAERNCRAERNASHRQPHENLTSLCRHYLFVGSSAANLRIVIVASTRCRVRCRSEFPSPRDEEACELPHKQVSRTAQITNATVPDTDVSFQVGGLCYLLLPA